MCIYLEHKKWNKIGVKTWHCFIAWGSAIVHEMHSFCIVFFFYNKLLRNKKSLYFDYHCCGIFFSGFAPFEPNYNQGDGKLLLEPIGQLCHLRSDGGIERRTAAYIQSKLFGALCLWLAQWPKMSVHLYKVHIIIQKDLNNIIPESAPHVFPFPFFHSYPVSPSLHPHTPFLFLKPEHYRNRSSKRYSWVGSSFFQNTNRAV